MHGADGVQKVGAAVSVNSETRCCLSVASGISNDKLSVGPCVGLSLSKGGQTLHNPSCRCQTSRPILIKENNVSVIFQHSHTGSTGAGETYSMRRYQEPDKCTTKVMSQEPGVALKLQISRTATLLHIYSKPSVRASIGLAPNDRQ